MSTPYVKEVNIVINDPVIFCGGAGGGANEYDAPVAASSYILNVAVPVGYKIAATWYTFFDNINNAFCFANLEVEKLNDTQVTLTVSSYPGSRGRVRLHIHSLITLTAILP